MFQDYHSEITCVTAAFKYFTCKKMSSTGFNSDSLHLAIEVFGLMNQFNLNRTLLINRFMLDEKYTADVGLFFQQ